MATRAAPNKEKCQKKKKGCKEATGKVEEPTTSSFGKEGDPETEAKEFEMTGEIGAILNLSKKKLKEFPSSLLDKMSNVQYLYLEGNELAELPANFFKNLHQLKWLDLRNNNLSALPSIGLKNHPYLEVILLQGNKIGSLPVELATINSLKGLQISGNPVFNVPPEEMAKGFKGIMNHLQKLYSQGELSPSASDIFTLKPSTSQEKNPKTIDTNDSNLRMYNLQKLSQWRQFMKKKSGEMRSEWNNYVQKSSPDKIRSPQTKISVSVNTYPKVPIKPAPFRCGVYNKARHRITASALHYRRLRKMRLGYKRRPITLAMIQEKARKESHMAQVRETLEKQAEKIQRMRNKEVLKTWRDHARRTREQMKLLDNYQQYPSKDFANKTPFDVDPEFLNMLNRVDLYRSLKDYDNRSKRTRKPKVRVTAMDLERQMNEIMKQLQQLDTNFEEESKSPRTKKSHMCYKMHKIMDIQNTLKNLQALNSSVSGITLTLKRNSKK